MKDVAPVVQPELEPSRSGRRRFPNKRHADIIPITSSRIPRADSRAQDLVPVREASPISAPGSPQSATSMPGAFDNSMDEPAFDTFTTDTNEFGLYRVYPHRPSHDPDHQVSVESVCDAPGLAGAVPVPSDTWHTGMTQSLLGAAPKNPLEPLTSESVFHLLDWFYRSSTLSVASLTDLVRNVIPKIDQSDPAIADFSAAREFTRLDTPLSSGDGWNNDDILIPVPMTYLKAKERTDAHVYTVPGARWRSLVDTMSSFFSTMSMDTFHITPFKIFRVGVSEPEPVYSEIYNSSVMYDEYVRVRDEQKSKSNLEVVIAAIMLWSDSTHLANFGTASLWPVYMYFGNISKYIRGKPSSFSAHHVAYLPKVCNSWLYPHALFLTAFSSTKATFVRGT
jgi:hypothetical protein